MYRFSNPPRVGARRAMLLRDNDEKFMFQFRKLLVALLLSIVLLIPAPACAEADSGFIDVTGKPFTPKEPPQRVVSLVPSVTEILFRIGAGDAVGGVTYHDLYPPRAATRSIVGGFFAPSPERIAALSPDLIFVEDSHRSVMAAYDGSDHPRLVRIDLNRFDDLYPAIRKIGRLFRKEAEAEHLIESIRSDLDHTARKTAAISPAERKRVIRLMGRDQVMTPGDDSFQNELIRLAGGVPPSLGKTGKIVPVSLAEWRAFNPQVIYGCGGDRTVGETLLNRPEWRDVDAVKNHAIHYLPCDLTCRLSSRTGHFVSCLASRIYADRFAVQEPVRPTGITDTRPLTLDLDYVARARVVHSAVHDYIHKTLVITLSTPMSVSSTLEGFRENIRNVGNSYSPPQCWGLYHRIGLDTSRGRLLDSINLDRRDTALLFTGADMDNLSIQRQQFREMTVYALVTAGVRSNALRMSADTGNYYEPGTINMVLLTNMKLSPRAMNRAIISATEAKTAALWDMDIRSAYTPLTNPATGTGTDNIIVVEGAGTPIENAGGHTKMGELIARAVYAGVREAVFNQNGIVPNRSVFQRLNERRISIFGLIGECACNLDKHALTEKLEELLLTPRYAGFMETALAISDRRERGLVTDITGFQNWCSRISEEIAGRRIDRNMAFPFSEPLTPVLSSAFEALLNGIAGRAEPPVSRERPDQK